MSTKQIISSVIFSALAVAGGLWLGSQPDWDAEAAATYVRMLAAPRAATTVPTPAERERVAVELPREVERAEERERRERQARVERELEESERERRLQAYEVEDLRLRQRALQRELGYRQRMRESDVDEARRKAEDNEARMREERDRALAARPTEVRIIEERVVETSRGSSVAPAYWRNRHHGHVRRHH